MDEGILARRCIASAPTDMPPYSSAVGITATGLSRASSATIIPTNPTPPLIPSIRRCWGPRTSTIPARPPRPPAKKRRQHQPPPHVDPRVMRRRPVEPGNNQLVSQRHLLQQHPNEACGDDRDQNPRMRPCSGQNERQPGGARKQFRFRLASRLRGAALKPDIAGRKSRRNWTSVKSGLRFHSGARESVPRARPDSARRESK